LRVADRFNVNEQGKITEQENHFDPRDVTNPGWAEKLTCDTSRLTQIVAADAEAAGSASPTQVLAALNSVVKKGTRAMNYQITNEQVAFYRENGFVILENFLDAGELETWRRCTDEAVEERLASKGLADQPERPGSVLRAGLHAVPEACRHARGDA
jgi:hypothetical protein